jgi:hypothetical protein
MVSPLPGRTPPAGLRASRFRARNTGSPTNLPPCLGYGEPQSAAKTTTKLSKGIDFAFGIRVMIAG